MSDPLAPAVVPGLGAGLGPNDAGLGEIPASLFNPQCFTLENGLEVIVVPNRRAPVGEHCPAAHAGGAGVDGDHAGAARLRHGTTP